MKILFFSKQGLHPLHLGTELELMSSLLEKGHDVYSLICESTLQSCYSNPSHNLIACSICAARTRIFLKKIGIKKEKILPLKEFEESKNLQLPKFESLEDVLSFEYKGVNVGRGIASSTISIERDYEIVNPQKKNALLEVQAKMAVNVLLNLEHYIEKIKPDEVYLFNGRFAELSPIINLCKKLGITFYTFEKASSNSRYQIFKNSSTHTIGSRQNLMIELWKDNSVPLEEKEKIASNWFEAKRLGVAKNVKNFLSNQVKNKIPENLNRAEKINISIFNSSEDEMKALEGWKTPLYEHQNDAIKKILERFKNDSNYHFYLRIHPNLGKVNNRQTKELNELNYSNLTIIPPFSEIDSYFLAETSHKVISFGSTMGIEATYWGKPSILFGRSFYEGIEAVYEPKSYKELEDLIRDPNLSPLPKENTYQYSFFLQTYGEAYKSFLFKDKHHSYFKEERLKRVYPLTIIKLFSFLPKFNIWKKLTPVVMGAKLNLSNFLKIKSHTIE